MADGPLSRRDFVKGTVIAASCAALGVGAVGSVLPLWPTSAPKTPAPILIKHPGGAQRTATVRDLDGDGLVVAHGTWLGYPAMLLKVKASTLEASSAARGYNTAQHAVAHPTEPDMALLAYDARCTHMGCTVGFNRTLGESHDIPDYEGEGVAGRVLCPCHQAQFDVFDLGKNLAGPAPRPLGVLRLRLGDPVDGSPSLEGIETIRQATYRAADRAGDGAAYDLG